jgi:Arc/MetJ family transcription regulator
VYKLKEVAGMHRTNIELDEKLVKEALKLSCLKTKKAVVHYALQELVRKKKRKRLLELEGKVEWRGNLERMRRTRT